MSHVAIIYFTQTGTTRQIANALQEGVMSVRGASCQAYSIEGSKIAQGRFVDEACMQMVDQADAVIFGSPTYMGGPAAQFKAFADATSDRWEEQQWSNKVAAGFTVGTSPGGDQLSTLQYFSVLAAQHGMLWVGLDMPLEPQVRQQNTQGTQLGLSVHVTNTAIQKADALTANYLGARVATMANSTAGRLSK